jgi:hypothetical protein
MAQCQDFGVETDNHYRALKAVLFNDLPGMVEEPFEQRFLELEEANGNGNKLNSLVKKYAPEWVGKIEFWTLWDEMYGREKESEKS